MEDVVPDAGNNRLLQLPSELWRGILDYLTPEAMAPLFLAFPSTEAIIVSALQTQDRGAEGNPSQETHFYLCTLRDAITRMLPKWQDLEDSQAAGQDNDPGHHDYEENAINSGLYFFRNSSVDSDAAWIAYPSAMMKVELSILARISLKIARSMDPSYMPGTPRMNLRNGGIISASPSVRARDLHEDVTRITNLITSISTLQLCFTQIVSLSKTRNLTDEFVILSKYFPSTDEKRGLVGRAFASLGYFPQIKLSKFAKRRLPAEEAAALLGAMNAARKETPFLLLPHSHIVNRPVSLRYFIKLILVAWRALLQSFVWLAVNTVEIELRDTYGHLHSWDYSASDIPASYFANWRRFFRPGWKFKMDARASNSSRAARAVRSAAGGLLDTVRDAFTFRPRPWM